MSLVFDISTGELLGQLLSHTDHGNVRILCRDNAVKIRLASSVRIEKTP